MSDGGAVDPPEDLPVDEDLAGWADVSAEWSAATFDVQVECWPEWPDVSGE